MPKKTTSDKNISFIVIALLLFSLFIPILGIAGLITMWTWTQWPRWVKVLISVPYILLAFFSAAGLTYMLYVRPIKIVGQAMMPSYRNGGYFVAKVYNPTRAITSRYDVIVSKDSQNPEVQYIKRVIGMPGDTVMLEGGYVYLNSQKLDESSYIAKLGSTYGGSSIKEGQRVTVPSDQYFVLGDNRTLSSDSRNWGFVTSNNIISKVWFCYWNCN